jgi:hypothetical protein
MNNYKLIAMKKVLIFLIIILVCPTIKSGAQNANLEKLNTYKIGFFTKKLSLTSQEAERFWPVYNDYQTQKNQIQLEKVSIIRNFNLNESNLNDNQLAELGDKLVATIVQESALAVTFHKKLKEVLPPAKVIRFYQAENQFKAQLLNELQGTKQQLQQQRPMQRRNLQ